MTRNTLEYLKLLETIRNNKEVARLRGAELAELIQNNRRVFRINLSKNAIDKLKNDQLDERERDKLNREIDLKLKELEERIRHDRADETNSRFTAIMRGYSHNPAGAAIGSAVAAGDEYLRNPKNDDEIPLSVNIGGKDYRYDQQDPLGPGMSLEQYDKYIGKDKNPGLRQRISEGYVVGFTGTRPEGGKDEVTTSKVSHVKESRFGRGKERGPGENLPKSNNSGEGSQSSTILSKEVKERRETGPGIGAAFY